MNKLTIIGNLTRDPEMRTTGSGLSVCNFTVAVNQRKAGDTGEHKAQYFRVTAWRKLGEVCQQYLSKGRKVAVVGPVSVSTYQANDGSTRAQLEVTAEDVEFLSGQTEGVQAAGGSHPAAPAAKPDSGYEEVEDDDLPF